ncbi:bifunctional folylpolyglutamate synthase/dihydrofolate synthase, partial [Verrucomicrobiota bacterium]
MNQALKKLYKRRSFGIKPGLDAERAMLSKLGNPQEEFLVVHVAGTNGKGSVCALLSSILRTAGYTVGLYTSPHLVRFNERIRVDDQEIGDDELAGVLDKIECVAADVARDMGQEPTFFECATAMAFKYFKEQDVRIAVVETGMGGRLDATNVLTPLISVITRISLEHTMYLGNDVEAVALEKCGIIKKGRPVVCGIMDALAHNMVKRSALEKR